jgi:nucleotidyltransferase-like protein
MIDETTTRYLESVDNGLPGLVEGFYVVGSAALGAWQPGVSDIDTIILTSRPLTAEDRPALEKVHAGMLPAPRLDGVYLDPGLLRSFPDTRQVTPFVVDGELKFDKPCGELNPVLWLTLQRHGRRLRGPAIADLGIDVRPEALRRYNLDNLRSYWQPLVADVPTDPSDDTPVPADPLVWLTLGPARLHHTLAHGDVISKAAAGTYLAALFPQYADLAHRAIARRAGAPQEFTFADLRTAAASVHAVADDAWNRFG